MTQRFGYCPGLHRQLNIICSVSGPLACDYPQVNVTKTAKIQLFLATRKVLRTSQVLVPSIYSKYLKIKNTGTGVGSGKLSCRRVGPCLSSPGTIPNQKGTAHANANRSGFSEGLLGRIAPGVPLGAAEPRPRITQEPARSFRRAGRQPGTGGAVVAASLESWVARTSGRESR